MKIWREGKRISPICSKLIKNNFDFNDNHFIIHKAVKTLTKFVVVTTSQTPGGASFPFSAQRCRETVEKVVAVVGKEGIFVNSAFVVFGATLDAFDTQFSVAGRGFLDFFLCNCLPLDVVSKCKHTNCLSL